MPRSGWCWRGIQSIVAELAVKYARLTAAASLKASWVVRRFSLVQSPFISRAGRKGFEKKKMGSYKTESVVFNASGHWPPCQQRCADDDDALKCMQCKSGNSRTARGCCHYNSSNSSSSSGIEMLPSGSRARCRLNWKVV